VPRRPYPEGQGYGKPRLSEPEWTDIVKRFVPWLLVAVLFAPMSAMAQEPLPLEPELGLQATTFATDLAFPAGMVVLPDGSVLVGASVSTTGGFYDSVGEIVRLVDADGDGAADQPYERVATGLPGSITALALAGDLLFVTAIDPAGPAILALRMTDDFSGPYAAVGSIGFHFQNALHQTYGLATRPTPGGAPTWDLLFNIGASGNDTGGSMVSLTGLIEDTLPDSAVYLATVHDDGASVVLSRPIAVATGIRNTSAMVFDPDTGDLWIGENGIDGFEDPFVAFSADELNVVPAEAIGGETIDFGFPDTYTRSDTGAVVGSTGAAPFTVFLPLGGSENEGVSSLAFAPASFPADLQHGLFAGFHGQWDLVGIENEENPLLWVSTESDEMRTVVGNDAPTVGHLDTLVATDDALYVADFCADGYFWQTEPCGVVYRVTAAV
jgi:glucose/arabinose dehydrogenase